jgi:hypothetical protein
MLKEGLPDIKVLLHLSQTAILNDSVNFHTVYGQGCQKSYSKFLRIPENHQKSL